MKRYIWLLPLFWMFASCGDEDQLTPSDSEENRLEQYLDVSYPLIKKCHEEYGTYILYDFDHLRDFSYQFDQAQTWRDAQITRLEPGDIEAALKFMEDYFLPYYKDEIEGNGVKVETRFREQYLPRKILLVSKLYASIASTTWKYFNAVANINSFTLAKMSASQIEEMKRLEGELEKYVIDMHYTFLVKHLYEAKEVELATESFYDLSRTFYAQTAPTLEEGQTFDPKVFWAKGFFEPADANVSNYPTKSEDITRYISEMLNLDASLAMQIDYNRPVIKAKMKYVVNHLQKMGIDILAMNAHIARAISD